MKIRKEYIILISTLILSTFCSKNSPNEPENIISEISIDKAKMILRGPVNHFDFSHNFPEVIIANINRNGIYKSNDAGRTWNKIYSAGIIKMCIDDSSPSTIYSVVPT